MSSTEHMIARPSTIRKAMKRTAENLSHLPDFAKESQRIYHNTSFAQELAGWVDVERGVLERLQVAYQVATDQESKE